MCVNLYCNDASQYFVKYSHAGDNVILDRIVLGRSVLGKEGSVACG